MIGISFVVGPQRANLVASICTHQKHSDRASSLIPWCCLLDLGVMQLGDAALGLGMCKAKDRRGRAMSIRASLPPWSSRARRPPSRPEIATTARERREGVSGNTQPPPPAGSCR